MQGKYLKNISIILPQQSIVGNGTFAPKTGKTKQNSGFFLSLLSFLSLSLLASFGGGVLASIKVVRLRG